MRKDSANKIHDWNRDCPIGTFVQRFALMKPRREPQGMHRTTSTAWLLGGHTAVVMLENFSGCVALDALELVEQEDEQEEAEK